MRDLAEALKQLPDYHQDALRWFVAHQGEQRTWDELQVDDRRLVMKFKGIYKPSWTTYALSVRETLQTDYSDHQPRFRSDATWTYLYFQEGTLAAKRDNYYTNRALIRCMKDLVPVGVLRQVKARPTSRYQVLGLAIVARWDSGYFLFEGFSRSGESNDLQSPAEKRRLLSHDALAVPTQELPEPLSFTDGTDRVLRSIALRRGQPKFRRTLLEVYDRKCAISRCDAEDALEAAHITPYSESQIDGIDNGILLRADLHALFDLGLIAIDTTSMSVVISPTLVGTTYRGLAGTLVHLPEIVRTASCIGALDNHRKRAMLDSVSSS